MGISIYIDHENKIIHYTHSGSLTRAEIGDAWQRLLKMEEFTKRKYNLLSDYSNASFSMELEEADMIADFLAGLKEILNGKKQALIISDPQNVALSMIFEDRVSRKTGFIVKVFASRQSGLNWLMK